MAKENTGEEVEAVAGCSCCWHDVEGQSPGTGYATWWVLSRECIQVDCTAREEGITENGEECPVVLGVVY